MAAVVTARRAAGISLNMRFWRRYFSNPVVVLATTVLSVVLIAALIGPALPNLDPFGLGMPFQSPSLAHPMGTDQLGRNVLARVIWGCRSALIVGLGSASISMIIGTLLGSIGGYYTGLIGTLVTRLIDIVLSVPIFFVALLVGYLLGAGLMLITLVLGLTMWPATARVVRAEFLAMRERGYVEAARSIGASERHIIFREILPNAIHPAIALMTLDAAWAILAEAGLAFLGLQDPSTVTWGFMLNEALSNYQEAWWDAVFPGVALSLLALSFNAIGDGLNDAWNPRLRRSLSVAGAIRAQPATTEKRYAPGSTVLDVSHLTVTFPIAGRQVPVVDDVSFSIRQSEIVGLVGESGSGKTMTALALAALVPSGGIASAARVEIAGRSVLHASASELRDLRSKHVAIAFQDPQSALNPVARIGDQIAEAIVAAKGVTRGEAMRSALRTLEELQIPAAAARMRAFPHELSGGMRQRVLIGIALSRDPQLLVVDEPTTSLDVITQKQVLELFARPALRSHRGILLITHDIGVVAEVCDRIVVMYAGAVVETGDSRAVLRDPGHPYTRALIDAVPDVSITAVRPKPIRGSLPQPWALPSGCRFRDRCESAMPMCDEPPPMIEAGPRNEATCWLLTREGQAASEQRMRIPHAND